MEKHCPKCHTLAEFRIIKKTGKTKGYCNACEVAITRIWRQRPENSARLNERKRARIALEPDFYAKEYQANREKRLASTKKCNAKHIDKRRAYRKYYLSIPENRLKHNLRRRIREILFQTKTRKVSRAMELLGCDLAFLRAYLEAKFVPGMTWENYGAWHVDHVLPCARFNLADADEQRKCFHYTNLQPLWARDNLSKGAR